MVKGQWLMFNFFVPLQRDLPKQLRTEDRF